MLALVAILGAFVFYWAFFSRKNPDEPPILPGSWPLLGHVHLFLGDSMNFWRQLKKISYECMKMGHATYFYMGPHKFYLLTDPDDIHKVSNTCLAKDSITHEFVKDLLGEGLLFLPVPSWKKHKKLINPTFNQQILDSFVKVFNSQGRRLTELLACEINKGDFDHTLHVRQNFMETIYLTVFDETINEEDAQNYVRCFQTYLNNNFTRFQKPWFYLDIIYRFSSIKRKIDESGKILHDVCASLLKKTKIQKKLQMNECNKDSSGQKLKRFIDLLIEVDENQLTTEEVRNEINTIIIAGHDTSANVVSYTLLLLGSYPRVQEKLYKELLDVLGNTNEDVEKQDLSRLVYLEAVLKESMRYYVVAPIITRYIDQEVKLKNHTLQAGNNCILLLYSIHRHPMWGPDVEEFKPERWLDPATIPDNPNAFVAFSLGKRNCIGKSYAMISMKILLVHFLRRYKIHADDSNIVLKLDVLLKPVSGHHISIEERMK